MSRCNLSKEEHRFLRGENKRRRASTRRKKKIESVSGGRKIRNDGVLGLAFRFKGQERYGGSGLREVAFQEGGTLGIEPNTEKEGRHVKN